MNTVRPPITRAGRNGLLIDARNAALVESSRAARRRDASASRRPMPAAAILRAARQALRNGMPDCGSQSQPAPEHAWSTDYQLRRLSAFHRNRTPEALIPPPDAA